jgi:hypothetical protein
MGSGESCFWQLTFVAGVAAKEKVHNYRNNKDIKIKTFATKNSDVFRAMVNERKSNLVGKFLKIRTKVGL